MGTWTAYGNQYWPAKYLIDAEGQVRYVHFGEGEYDETEAAIRTLLREKGDSDLGGDASKVKGEEVNPARPHPRDLPGRRCAPRAGRTAASCPATQSFGEPPSDLRPERVRLLRRLDDHRGGRLVARRRRDQRQLRRREGLPRPRLTRRPRDVEVLLDGEPIPDALAGEDVKDGVATIGPQRLYRLVDLPEGRQPRARAALRAGDLRLRVHVRLGRVRPACARSTRL